MMQSEVQDEFNDRHFVEVGAARVCYSKVGAGPALVLLHGYPLSGQTWRKIVPALAKRFTCYAFDVIGLGNSTSRDAEDFSSPGQARVLRRALSTLGVSSYSLIGNDSGGWIAREMALLEPERVTRLVLTNTEIPGHRPPWVSFYQFLARLPGGVFLFQRMLASRRWRRSGMGFGGCFDNLDLIEGDFFKEFILPLLSSPRRLSRALRFLKQMKFQHMDRFLELHRRLAMPVAFVWGAADPTFPEELALPMTSQFPHVTHFISIPRGKLFLQEEFPESMVGPVIEALTGVTTTPGSNTSSTKAEPASRRSAPAGSSAGPR